MNIFEAITTIPNLEIYFKNREKELFAAANIIKQNSKIFFNYDESKDENFDFYLFNKIFRDIEIPSKYRINQIVEKLFELSKVCKNILDYGLDFLKYFKSNMDFLSNDISELDSNSWKNIFTNNVKNIMYEFEHDENNPEKIALLAALKSLQTISDEIEKVSKNIERYNLIINAVIKKQNYNFDPHKYRPDHDDIEQLYHVSIYCNDILKKGFQAEKPEEYKGVGNFGNQKDISFTHSLSIAQSILRAFKEIWMIVHEQIKPEQLLSWIEKDGISHKEIKKSIGGFYPDDNTKYIPKNLSEMLKLYRYFLLFQKVRIDPWIVNMQELADAMKSVDYKSIGILICEVKLKDSSYHEGEKEFRVKPENVLSINRFL